MIYQRHLFEEPNNRELVYRTPQASGLHSRLVSERSRVYILAQKQAAVTESKSEGL